MKKLKDHHTTKELIAIAKKASERAWNENFALGLPIVIEEDGKIIRKYKDGTIEIVKQSKKKKLEQ